MTAQFYAFANKLAGSGRQLHMATITRSDLKRHARILAIMKVVADRIVSLGFGKYVRADKIVALVPIEEDRGSGRRTMVYVDGLSEPLVAGRTEPTILRDMVGTESGAIDLLRELQAQIGAVRPLLKSSIRSEAGLDLDRLSWRISDLTGEG